MKGENLKLFDMFKYYYELLYLDVRNLNDTIDPYYTNIVDVKTSDAFYTDDIISDYIPRREDPVSYTTMSHHKIIEFKVDNLWNDKYIVFIFKSKNHDPATFNQEVIVYYYDMSEKKYCSYIDQFSVMEFNKYTTKIQIREHDDIFPLINKINLAPEVVANRENTLLFIENRTNTSALTKICEIDQENEQIINEIKEWMN